MNTNNSDPRLRVYTKQYFKDRFHGPLVMAETIKIFLSENRVKKVLDVGCGSGWLIRYLTRFGIQAEGCDIADEAVKMSKQVKASATSLPFKSGNYDAVLGISLIEHLTPLETRKFFREARRVLKRDGWFFLDTPNFATPWRWLYGRRWSGYSDSTHIHFYTPQKLRRELAFFGFSDFRITFPYYPYMSTDFGLPPVLKKGPLWFRRLMTFLVLSTPFYIFRHSFWLAARKK